LDISSNKRKLCYLVIFLEGFAVLGIEIAGTRMLGPHFGASVHLWASLISVALLSLSVGYMIGGRLVDRLGTRSRILPAIVLLAAFCIPLIPRFEEPILALFEPLGLKWVALLGSWALFTIPLTLLGMVTPFILKMITRSLEEVGAVAGRLYGASTLASVLSAVITGYFLIPRFGSDFVLHLIAFVVVLMGFCLIKVQSLSSIWKAAFIAMSAWGAVGLWLLKEDVHPSLLAVRHGHYGEIRVIDQSNARYLLIEGEIHSGVQKKIAKSTYPYSVILRTSKAFFDTPGKGLILGLGAGTTVKEFTRSGWEMHVAEIDPVVIETAYDFFDIDLPRKNVAAMDGRRYLYESQMQFDLIFFDAFGGSGIPFHLTSLEVFALAKSRLRSGGVVALNVIADGWDSKLLHSLMLTLKEHFVSVVSLPTSSNRDDLQSVIVFAADWDLEDYLLSSKWSHTDLDPRFFSLRRRAILNRIPHGNRGQILTDNLNPADLWGDDINFKNRNIENNTVPADLLY